MKMKQRQLKEEQDDKNSIHYYHNVELKSGMIVYIVRSLGVILYSFRIHIVDRSTIIKVKL